MQKKGKEKGVEHVDRFEQPVDVYLPDHINVCLDCGPSLYTNIFHRRMIGCKKPEGYSTCHCHIVPDTIPMAMPLQYLPKREQQQLRNQGCVFKTDGVPWEMDWFINPVFNLYIVKHGLNLCGWTSAETCPDTIEYDPSVCHHILFCTSSYSLSGVDIEGLIHELTRLTLSPYVAYHVYARITRVLSAMQCHHGVPDSEVLQKF
jgi:hypothetical protein